MLDTNGTSVSAERCLTTAGLLWAFFGAGGFFLIQDVMLGNKLLALPRRASEAILGAIRCAVLVNFSALLFFQTTGIVFDNILHEHLLLILATWVVHAGLILGYLGISYFLDRAYRACLLGNEQQLG
jgi:hypothetical protein